MGIKIEPEKALKKVKEFLKQIGGMVTLDYDQGSKYRRELDRRIMNFIPVFLSNGEKKLHDYDQDIHYSTPSIGYGPYNEVEKGEVHLELLQKMKNHLLAFKEELELIISSKGYVEKIDRVEERTKKATKEGKRREAVVGTKLSGAIIEVIDLLREEVARKNELSKDMIDIKRDVESIRVALDEIKSTLAENKS